MIKQIYNRILKSIPSLFISQMEADGKVLSIVRIVYGFLGLLYIKSYIHAIPLIWYGIDLLNIFYLLSYIWIVVMLLILFGIRLRILYILNYLLIVKLIFGQNIMYTVEELWFTSFSFWLIFLKCDNFFSVNDFFKTSKIKRNRIVDGWPLYFFGLIISIQLFTAGITKLFDPLWFQGLGFYYTYLLPWIKADYTSFLLDYEGVMRFLNYLALFFELTVLPFYLFRKTRWIAIAQVFLFALLLTFPMNGLSFIGLFGLIISFVLLASDDILLEFFRIKKESKSQPYALSVSHFFNINKYNNFFKPIIIGSFSIFILAQFSINIVPKIFDLKYPYVLRPLKIVDKDGNLINELNIEHDKPKGLIYYAKAVINKLNRGTIQLNYFALFNSYHILGIYEYKVRAYKADGTYYEPIIVYNEDKTAGEYLSIFSGLWYETQMYHVSNVAHKLNGNIDYSPSNLEVQRLKGLIHFTKMRLNSEEFKNVVKIRLLLSPLTTPNKFLGNFDLIKRQPWIPLLSWDKETEEYRFNRNLPKINLRYPVFYKDNYFITL